MEHVTDAEIEHDIIRDYIEKRIRPNLGGRSEVSSRGVLPVAWIRIVADTTEPVDPNNCWFATKVDGGGAGDTTIGSARTVAMFLCRGPGRN